MRIKFTSEQTGRMNLRRGRFEIGDRYLDTPHFFPVVNFITGPPTNAEYLGEYGPTMANGGIWKWFKRLALRDIGVPEGADFYPKMDGFLTQILHFLDYHISEKMLDQWLGTLGNPAGRPITEYLNEELASVSNPATSRKTVPFLFLDSGGYKLLSATQIDLGRYGWKACAEDILNLQLLFGGDLLASLDYPVHQAAPDYEAKERFQKSMDNGLEALRLLNERKINDKLLFLAVHGRNRKEMGDYMRTLLGRVREEGLQDQPFGVALGSLVPLNASPRALVDTVRGGMEAFHAEQDIDTSKVPVHAFGVNSGLAPFLTLLGVDTYDGSSFVQSAQNLTYLQPRGFTPQRFESMPTLECACRACVLLSRGVWEPPAPSCPTGRPIPTQGLQAAQYLLSPDAEWVFERAGKKWPYIRWRDGYVDNLLIPPRSAAEEAEECGVPRSYLYALLALHNADTNFRQAKMLRDAADDPKQIEDLLAKAASNVKQRKILQIMCSAYPELSDYMWRVGVDRLGSRVSTRPLRARPEIAPVRAAPIQLSLKGNPISANTSRSEQAPEIVVNSNLGPSDFNILDTEYEMPKAPVLLLLPCSKRKPYSESSTHRFIEKNLRNAGIPMESVLKVTISGNYGPVPSAWESAPNVLSYDYMLHYTNVDQIELVAERTREFLRKFEGQYGAVVAYCTPRPYRKAIQLALDGRRNATLLPNPLGAHTISEFRVAKNVSQLVDEIRRHLPPE